MHSITVLRYPISAFNCEAQRFRERERERDGGREGEGFKFVNKKGMVGG